MRLVILRFGAWKNTYSSYVPARVKRDQARFGRVMTADGRGTERLSPFSQASRDADARAFAALMQHLKSVDGTRHTVVMVQVENEVGVIPESRDHSPAAEAAFDSPVPDALMRHLGTRRTALHPELRTAWEAAGGHVARGVRRYRHDRITVHVVGLCELHRNGYRRRKGPICAADVHQRRADPTQLRTGPV